MVERQAPRVLARLQAPTADELLESWLDRMLAKKAPEEIQLDIILAARDSKNPNMSEKLNRFEGARDPKNPTEVYRESMIGGDAESGRKIFFEKSEVSCLRCHKIAGNGGEVGPDLTGIGKKYKRDYLLESLVDPNKQIAKGFETVVVSLTNGQTKSGIQGRRRKRTAFDVVEGQPTRSEVRHRTLAALPRCRDAVKLSHEAA